MGGLIVVEQLILVVWGPDLIALPRPATLRGSVLIGDAAIESYRLLAVAVGLVVFVAMRLVLNRTKIGLLVRAGVENTRDGGGARLPHPAAVRRRVHRGLGAGRPRRRDVGLYQETITSHMGLR